MRTSELIIRDAVSEDVFILLKDQWYYTGRSFNSKCIIFLKRIPSFQALASNKLKYIELLRIENVINCSTANFNTIIRNLPKLTQLELRHISSSIQTTNYYNSIQDSDGDEDDIVYDDYCGLYDDHALINRRDYELTKFEKQALNLSSSVKILRIDIADHVQLTIDSNNLEIYRGCLDSITFAKPATIKHAKLEEFCDEVLKFKNLEYLQFKVDLSDRELFFEKDILSKLPKLNELKIVKLLSNREEDRESYEAFTILINHIIKQRSALKRNVRISFDDTDLIGNKILENYRFYTNEYFDSIEAFYRDNMPS